jgi:hypothetical protein
LTGGNPHSITVTLRKIQGIHARTMAERHEHADERGNVGAPLEQTQPEKQHRRSAAPRPGKAFPSGSDA